MPLKTKKPHILGTGGFMRPDEVLLNLEIKKGMEIADFGCGAGYFTILLAKLVGKEGTVYAVDVVESALDSVRGKAKFSCLFNIETIRGNLEKMKGSGLKDACCDMVVLANVLFQSPDKPAILKEARRVLKKSGKIVVIEWREDAPFGPEVRYRIGKEALKQMVKEAGFVLEKEFPAGSSHYGLVFSL